MTIRVNKLKARDQVTMMKYHVIKNKPTIQITPNNKTFLGSHVHTDIIDGTESLDILHALLWTGGHVHQTR